MHRNFTRRITMNGKESLAVIIPQHRKDGMYYEVNIKDIPRFYMKWSATDRYDIEPESQVDVPYDVVLAVSDAIEEEARKN